MVTANNPILPGTYPDPSICRVDDTYYLVTSTFTYWPGLPIFRSKDLVSWEQIGHVIDRPSQMTFDGLRWSHALYAPTIRHHDGLFWLVCTVVGRPDNSETRTASTSDTGTGGNFVVTATDPAGPWSDPIWLNFAGIDPSLFFDDDGRAWMHGTRLVDEDRAEWHHQTEVWLRELDTESMTLSDEEHILWTGAVRGAVWAEGPHLYKVDGRYYLLAAEGGTDFHHAISVARSDSVTGPYEGNKANPILTHRNLGRAHDVVGVGHADLVQAPDGSWWSVMLAMRTYGGYHYNLGRETWLAPVTWEDGWPVFAPGTARLADTVDLPWASAGEPLGECQGATSGVVAPTSLRWTALRGPGDSFAAPSGEGWNLTARPQTIAEPTIPAFLGVRQQHKSLDVSTSLDASVLRPGEEAGLVVLQGEFDSLRIVVRDGAVEARMRVKGEERTLASTEVCACGSISLRLAIRGQEYALQYQDRQGDWATLTVADGSEIDTASAGGFTGLWLGIYASSNGAPTGTRVEFGPLNYEPRD